MRGMLRSLVCRLLGVLILGGVLSMGVLAAEREESLASGKLRPDAVVDLFDAIRSRDLDVTVRPRDAHEVRVEFKNKTEKPIFVEFPKALVAMPVLPQFFPQQPGPGAVFGNPQFNPNHGQGAQAPQVLGVAPQQNGFPRQNNNPFNPGRNNGNGPGPFIFNVPAEKVIRITMTSLCLEYGKREPHERNAYELRPLATYTDNVTLRELMEYYGQGKCRMEIAQIAAWHLANDMGWEEMKGMTKLKKYGKIENVFNTQAVEQAKGVVDQLPSRRKKSDTLIATPVSLQPRGK